MSERPLYKNPEETTAKSNQLGPMSFLNWINNSCFASFAGTNQVSNRGKSTNSLINCALTIVGTPGVVSHVKSSTSAEDFSGYREKNVS